MAGICCLAACAPCPEQAVDGRDDRGKARISHDEIHDGGKAQKEDQGDEIEHAVTGRRFLGAAGQDREPQDQGLVRWR